MFWFSFSQLVGWPPAKRLKKIASDDAAAKISAAAPMTDA
jgi:hypothetical protein